MDVNIQLLNAFSLPRKELTEENVHSPCPSNRSNILRSSQKRAVSGYFVALETGGKKDLPELAQIQAQVRIALYSQPEPRGLVLVRAVDQMRSLSSCLECDH